MRIGLDYTKVRDLKTRMRDINPSNIVIVNFPSLDRIQGVEGWGLNQNDNILNGLANRRFSRPKLDLFMAQDMSYNIITYAEINFIKAEAQHKGWGGSRSAEQYYYEGIDASFQQYGATGVTEYKNRAGIQWGTSSVGDRGLFGVVTSGISNDPLDKITRQRWLASYNQGHDIWCMQKRTRALPLIDQFAPDGATGLDYAPVWLLRSIARYWSYHFS